MDASRYVNVYVYIHMQIYSQKPERGCLGRGMLFRWFVYVTANDRPHQPHISMQRHL